MDIVSYILGYEAAGEAVVIESDSYTFTDTDSDGTIVIEEVE